MKKHLFHFLCLSVATLALPLSGKAQLSVQPDVLVCRAHQCADPAYSMTTGFLFNKIAQLFKNNIGKTVLLCEADPISHICLNNGIEISAETAFAPTEIVIDSLRLTDEHLLNGETGLDAVFDYRIRANNTYPACQLAVTRVSVNDVSKIDMTTQDTICNITETGRTSINATYAVNYLDFDYGILGAYYTIGVGESVQGDKLGYLMMRFTEKAPQTTEVISDEQPEKVEVVEESETVNTLPSILRQTTPEVSIEELLSQKTTETVTETKAEEPVLEETVALPEAEATVKIEEEPPVPTVVKTTIIEKTVITPDGKHQVSPPEKRTLINGELQL